MTSFSVLLSVYSREQGEFLKAALQSVFNQTLMPDEVILVKDGPLTTGLECVINEFCTRYSTLKAIALPCNVGLGTALNEGLKHCRCPLVARMDSDDICAPTRFEKQVALFEKQTNLSVVGSWVSEFATDPTQLRSMRSLPETDSEIKKFAQSRNPVNHPSVMFKAAAVNSVGGYKPFYLFEDYYLWGRLIKRGFEFANIPESLVWMRTGDGLIGRRGGLAYVKSEIRLQRAFLKMGLINRLTFLKNVFIRVTVRLMPNSLRANIYQKFLRN